MSFFDTKWNLREVRGIAFSSIFNRAQHNRCNLGRSYTAHLFGGMHLESVKRFNAYKT